MTVNLNAVKILVKCIDAVKSDSSELPPRRRYHHGDLKRAIEETTLSIIESDGVNSVSLRAVARRLGVTEGAPYHHFASKSELLAVLAVNAYRGLHERMIAAANKAGDDPYARLLAAGRSYVDYGLQSRGRFRTMFGEHTSELATDADVYAAAHPTRVMLQQLVADCVGQGNKNALTIENAVWSLVHGMTWLILEREILPVHGSDEVDATVIDAIGLLLRGIRSSQGSG